MNRKINLFIVTGALILATACKKDEKPTKQLAPTQAIDAPQINPENTTILPEEPRRFPIPADGKYPVISFNETEFDFGKIKQGDVVEHIFTFTNTGKADLIIAEAKASCGCTVPDYPKDTPIIPGGSGKIKVTFDSNRKRGDITKTVTVICNTESGTEILTIKTNIESLEKGVKF
jgi:hypothetical protein